jgi:hypothetical protein
MQIWKKVMNVGGDQQVSANIIDGMGGVMNE